MEQFEKAKILMVDDRPENLVALETILAPLDAEIHSAQSGNGALEKMLDQDYALVLMDVQMPGMDGFETVELMRKDRRLENTPVIFVSAIYREEVHSLIGIERGAVDFIVKPIVPEVLLGKARVFLDLYREKAELMTLNRELQVSEKTLRWELRVNESLTELANHLMKSPDINVMAEVVYRVSLSLTDSEAGCISEISHGSGKGNGECTPLVCDEILQGVNIMSNSAEEGDSPGIKDVMVIPALNGSQVVGEIILANTKSEFTRDKREAMEKVATFFALAVQRSRDESERLKLESDLRQSEKMRAIGQLAGGVAHDFNNQLAAIMGNAELCLNEENLTSESVERLNQIVDVAERSGALTRQLLAYARKENVIKRRILPDDVLREVFTVLKRTIDRKIRIEMDLKAENAAIMGDSNQLYTAFLNIALNSRDAMPDGGRLRFISRVKGNSVLIEIRDTGVGIPEEIQDKIFEPFFTTKDVWKGTGLGLSAVQGIAKMHGASLELESRPDKGTTVILRFPLFANDALDSVPKGKQESASVISGKVLFAEDDDFFFQVGETFLRNTGFSVVHVSDGQEAVETYGKSPEKFDLIILDVIMPRMNGWEALREIKAIDSEAKVIMATGYMGDFRDEDIVETGAAGILYKPFRYHEMLKLINKTLG